MKNNLLTILILLFQLNLFGQTDPLTPTNVDFKFYDACNDTILDLPYELSSLDQDYLIEANDDTALVTPGFYMIHVVLQRDSLYSYHLFNALIDQNYKTDTLYLPRNSLAGTGELHSAQNFHNCQKLSDGKVTEFDQFGNLRFSGKFKKGLANGKLSYYSKSGHLIKEEVWKNGNLLEINDLLLITGENN